MSDFNSNVNPKKRSSKSVMERKRLSRRVKYNAIGVAKQQARIAAANVIKIDDEDVDLTDAFAFMDWYLANVESVANNEDLPTPESVVLEFRTNLMALDLTGACLREKVQFVMDVVRAPELHDVCVELLAVDEAVDAVTEVPLIDLSDDCSSIGTTLDATPCDDERPPLDVTSVQELTPVDFGTSIHVVDETHVDDVMRFIRRSLLAKTVPILMLDEAYENRDEYDSASYYVVHWKLSDFRRLYIDDDTYSEWLSNWKDDRSQRLNVMCCDQLETRHYYKRIYFRPGVENSVRITQLSGFRGFTGVSSGLYPHIGIVTTGENSCEFVWV